LKQRDPFDYAICIDVKAFSVATVILFTRSICFGRKKASRYM